MEKTQQLAFQIKGIREGLLIVIGPGEWYEVQRQLLEYIQQNAKFFIGAKLALDVGSRILSASELGKLRDLLADLETTLWAILSKSPTTIETAQLLGLATQIGLQKMDTMERRSEPQAAGENALLIQKTIRSGMKVKSVGHIIIVGDVNPGGEIVAGGSVIVWGKCRGVVHAGAEGDKQALVCALDLSPTQLRIAEFIAVSPKRKGKPQPEMAYINGDQVVAESWNPKTR